MYLFRRCINLQIKTNHTLIQINSICKESFSLKKSKNYKNTLTTKTKMNLKNPQNNRVYVFQEDGFNKGFLKENLKRSKLIFNNKFCFGLKFIEKNILKTKLLLFDRLISMKEMFFNKKSLISIKGLSNLDASHVKDMAFMFAGCKSLESIPDISKWNTKNVTSIEGIFGLCTSLKSIPDISKWNTNKFMKIRALFGKCKNLITIPDISNWNIKNVKCLDNMFMECSSL